MPVLPFNGRQEIANDIFGKKSRDLSHCDGFMIHFYFYVGRISFINAVVAIRARNISQAARTVSNPLGKIEESQGFKKKNSRSRSRIGVYLNIYFRILFLYYDRNTILLSYYRSEIPVLLSFIYFLGIFIYHIYFISPYYPLKNVNYFNFLLVSQNLELVYMFGSFFPFYNRFLGIYSPYYTLANVNLKSLL